MGNSCNTSYSSASYGSSKKNNFKVAMRSTKIDNMSQAAKEKLQNKEVEIMDIGRNTYV